MANRAKTDDDLVDEFIAQSKEISQLITKRQIAARRRAAVVEELQGRGWSLQRIADTVGLSKNAIAKAGQYPGS